MKNLVALIVICLHISVMGVLSQDNSTTTVPAETVDNTTSTNASVEATTLSVMNGTIENATSDINSTTISPSQNASEIVSTMKNINTTVTPGTTTTALPSTASSTTVVTTSSSTNGSSPSSSTSEPSTSSASTSSSPPTPDQVMTTGSVSGEAVECHGFDGPSFGGGIILAVGVIIISVILWKCYTRRKSAATPYNAF